MGVARSTFGIWCGGTFTDDDSVDNRALWDCAMSFSSEGICSCTSRMNSGVVAYLFACIHLAYLNEVIYKSLRFKPQLVQSFNLKLHKTAEVDGLFLKLALDKITTSVTCEPGISGTVTSGQNSIIGMTTQSRVRQYLG